MPLAATSNQDQSCKRSIWSPVYVIRAIWPSVSGHVPEPESPPWPSVPRPLEQASSGLVWFVLCGVALDDTS